MFKDDLKIFESEDQGIIGKIESIYEESSPLMEGLTLMVEYENFRILTTSEMIPISDEKAKEIKVKVEAAYSEYDKNLDETFKSDQDEAVARYDKNGIVTAKVEARVDDRYY